jgi:hypothetical protein
LVSTSLVQRLVRVRIVCIDRQRGRSQRGHRLGRDNRYEASCQASRWLGGHGHADAQRPTLVVKADHSGAVCDRQLVGQRLRPSVTAG